MRIIIDDDGDGTCGVCGKSCLSNSDDPDTDNLCHDCWGWFMSFFLGPVRLIDAGSLLLGD